MSEISDKKNIKPSEKHSLLNVAQLYVRVDITLTWGKHLHDRIIPERVLPPPPQKNLPPTS